MDDALVEKAARAIAYGLYGGHYGKPKSIDYEAARAVLALPDLRLAGLKEGLEMAAKECENRAECARVAAIGGGMDPLDAELLDYEYSNAATAIRAIPVGDDRSTKEN